MIANGAGISGQKGKQPCFEGKKRTLDGFSLHFRRTSVSRPMRLFSCTLLAMLTQRVHLFTSFLELWRKSFVMTLNQSTEAVFCYSICALGQVPNTVKWKWHTVWQQGRIIKGNYSFQAATIFLLQCSSDMGTWLNTQKFVTNRSTGSGDAVLFSLSEPKWINKVISGALLYQFPNKEMVKVHPPNMEASSRIVNNLLPFFSWGNPSRVFNTSKG